PCTRSSTKNSAVASVVEERPIFVGSLVQIVSHVDPEHAQDAGNHRGSPAGKAKHAHCEAVGRGRAEQVSSRFVMQDKASGHSCTLGVEVIVGSAKPQIRSGRWGTIS